MKKISALLILLTLAGINNSFAQIIYAIDKNSNYSASCNNCIFNIEAGATLTISQAGSCNNCTFNGGNIDIHAIATCQPCSFNGNNITLTNFFLMVPN